MSDKALAGIIIGCTIAIIAAIVLTRPPNGSNGIPTNELTQANFMVSDLRVSPSKIGPAQAANVTVRVTNVGNLSGHYQVVFKIDDVAVQTVSVYLTGGETRDITFTTPVGYSPGLYSLDINGYTGNLVVGETPSQLPLNVRIDYFAIKDAMGQDDYDDDPLYGEIQLIIVTTDGVNEPQTWYLPSEGPEGLDGYEIPDFARRQLSRRIYRADAAGNYLKLSILAYDLDSKDDLVTKANILEALATAAGVSGADILNLLISLLPVEDDRVGEYEVVWYPAEGYGVGQHQVTCLDKFARENLFLGFSIWSDEEPPLQLLPSPFPDTPNNETLAYRMLPNVMTGSYVQYRRELLAGEKVEGRLQLTGDYTLGWDTTCCFWIYDPDGDEVYKWCEDFRTGGLYHDFSFTATRHGVYAIKVGHGSWSTRHLDMTISPYGWR